MRTTRYALLILAVLTVLALACGGATGGGATPRGTPLPSWSRSGKGDAVVDVSFYTGKAYTRATLRHDGRGNFIVVPYDGANNRLLSLVNEIGPYSGSVKWNPRADSLEVKADGSWEITVSQ